MRKVGIFLAIFAGLLIQDVSARFFRIDESRNIMRRLVSYNSRSIKQAHDQLHFSDHNPESFYYSPFRNELFQNTSVILDEFSLLDNRSDTSMIQEHGTEVNIRMRRENDPTFRGNPKSQQEIWHRNFNFQTLQYQQTTSLVILLNKIVNKYLSACIPVVLYDEFVENSEGFIIQRLLQEFPTTFMHGKINSNYTLDDNMLLEPPDAKCRSYILFLADALMTRRVIGPQIDNKVIVVPRSTQWKLQEFLSSPLSRDIINLLVIGESYSADKTKENPYVLYTHQLYVDGLGSNRPILLTSFMKNRLTRPHIDLFPKKLIGGFSGHRFSVAAADVPPFVFKIVKTDGVGNVNIKWDGLEYRILQILARMYNFTIDVMEPKNLKLWGPGDAVGVAVSKKQFDIGMSGMYVTTERNDGMEMSVAHSTDCAAFITLASKALPRYRAILGPFQWPVWLALIIIYLGAIIPLAYSDRLSLRYLIDQPGQIENMFWYVFGTFTNSLTFTGELSWSQSKKTSTRMLIGWYWMFTIIITACYTGSIIAFVTLPVQVSYVDSIKQLHSGFYRIGTLDRGGWERWFLNSSQKSTAKLMKKLEFVIDIEEGINNVTQAFIWPYAFIGSRAQLDYVIQSNYSDDKLGKRSALHISDECFALFGTGFAFQEESVYRNILNDGILAMQQSGLIDKLMRDVKWDMVRSSTGQLLQISEGNIMKFTQTERKLTLVDTEGMFILLGIGFVVAGGALLSEVVGGLTNKCRRILKKRRADKNIANKEEEDRVYRETHVDDVDNDDGNNNNVDTVSVVSSGNGSAKLSSPSDGILEMSTQKSDRSDGSGHSRAGSMSVSNLNKHVLQDLYHGPKRRISNMVMINGKMMSEEDAIKYSNNSKLSEEKRASGSSNISKIFNYLDEEGSIDIENDGNQEQDESEMQKICEVEINHVGAEENQGIDIEASFGEKIDHNEEASNIV